ncbi:chain length-determining protein [Rheinheimera sp. SA_1]|jgi:polysaccharide chain length determinant protein (PEP-CTERM system associated)|uniref:XrtA system polysaccharide chain length determinant n=1 Tax=Rheinheimera sp. SA_1 TaxID=1827365 RepID=UPI0007FC12F2|nr:XrtA system polysaccharide chain length determinant [Rheinheimera sp. SA_1]OBP14603.1 chain length-determining protein [Rheinheimera sp. SA_1]
MKELNLAIEMLLIYLQGVWLRRRYIVITAWLVCPIGWILVFNMPPTFEANAKIYVETRSVLDPVLQGLTIRDNPEREIQLMARTLLSRPNLEKIARATDLDISASDSQSYENLINSLQNSIKLSAAGRENIYVISYANSSPQLAKRLVQETLNIFVESRVGNAVADKRKASEFIDSQITEYETRLAEAETRLSEFKKSQIAMGPMSDQGFYSRIESEKARLEEAQLRQRELEGQLESARRQLQGEASGFSDSTSGANSGFTTQYDDRIKTLQTQLDGLLIRYTDVHPDVIEVGRLIESLKKMRAEEISNLEKAIAGAPQSSAGFSQNQVYQELKLNVSRLENEIASVNVRVRNYGQKLEELERQRNIVPDIEAKFAGLNRDYEITKSKYEELLSRREQMDLSSRADESQQDVQFKIIEPPHVPIKPSGPPRLAFYTLVLFGGIAAGLFMAFARSQISPVVTSALQLKTIADFPVFGLVSHTQKDAMLKQNKKHLLYFLILSAMLMLCYCALVANEMVFGLTAKQLLGRLL